MVKLSLHVGLWLASCNVMKTYRPPRHTDAKPAKTEPKAIKSARVAPDRTVKRNKAETAATTPAVKMEPGRIAKLMARAGVASRREIERMISDGRVALKGRVLDSPALVLPNLDGITVDGRPLAAIEPVRLFRFHKPQGCVTSNFDPDGRRTIFDVLPKGLPRLVTVGRLDFNTEGLLLLTTDGGLARHLELPASGYIRHYRVRVFGTVDPKILEGLKNGVTVEGVYYGPIVARVEAQGPSNAWLQMALTEGKNREIRRICASLGFRVSRLMRVAFGPIGLETLAEGNLEEIASSTLMKLLPPPYGTGTGKEAPVLAKPDKIGKWDKKHAATAAAKPTAERRTAAERKATSFKQLQRDAKAGERTPVKKVFRAKRPKPKA